ncbi:hypothetical protein [Streptomyces sp. NPDC026659]
MRTVEHSARRYGGTIYQRATWGVFLAPLKPQGEDAQGEPAQPSNGAQ